MRQSTFLHSLSDLQLFLADRSYSSHFILTDTHTKTHCLPHLLGAVDSLNRAEVIEVEPGENSKSIELLGALWESLIDLGADRTSCLINLGGGVITDLGGFLASTFKRGIDHIHIPTSLLAMVDAAIGGKNGINVGPYKNQAGCVTQPNAIATCTEFLETLPERELRSGYAEMLKHALLIGGSHCDQLFGITILKRESLLALIPASQNVKRSIVEQDPLESGIRKHLNLGHTAGHAFESWSHSSDRSLTHGEAIALGMRVALHLSVLKSGMDPVQARSFDVHLKHHFPIHLPTDSEAAVQQWWQLMQADKKNILGELRFVLLQAPGKPVIDPTIDLSTFRSALRAIDFS